MNAPKPPPLRHAPERSVSDNYPTMRGLPSLSAVPPLAATSEHHLTPTTSSEHFATPDRPHMRDSPLSSPDNEVIQRKGPVDFVHHDSPCGPAVSVFPRGQHHHRRRPSYAAIAAAAPERPLLSRCASYSDRGGIDMAWRSDDRLFNGSGGSSSSHHHPPRHAVPAAGGEELSGYRPLPPQQVALTQLPSAAAARKKPPPPSHQHMVEISPGVQVRLRGSAETQEYVRRNWLVSVLCMACVKPMYCIQDASFVICPHCRVVNAVTGPSNHNNNGASGGGVALGMALDMLRSLKQEMLTQEGGGGSRYYHQQQPFC